MKDKLIAKLDDRTAKIGVVGLGYVGLPLVLRYLSVGYEVLGFDIDQSKVDTLLEGGSYLPHIDVTPLKPAVADKRFGATTDYSRAAEVDAIILCVPTPLDRHREPDLSFVINSVEAVAPYVRKGQVVSLESTTYPGTTEEEIRPRLEKSGLRAGQDIFVVYSPEREDPGNPTFTTHNTPKVCGGSTPACLEVGLALYRQAIDTVVPASSTQAAEMVKILENTFRAVNIALVNELKIVADRMGLDIFEIIRAAATKPFGYTPFYPGPGLGGHCIPIDPFYLTWKAREYGVNTRFIELAGEVNANMPEYVIHKVQGALNDKGKALKGARVLLLGVSYKKNVGDTRESPGVELLEKLGQLGALVDYSDPHVPKLPRMRKYDLPHEHTPIDADMLRGYDCVLIATDHKAFDWALIKEHARVIVDARGVYEVEAGRVYRG